MRFSRTKGHSTVKELFSRELDTGRLVTFYLLVGPEGVGKSLVGRSFGRYVLCGDKCTDECSCDSCHLYAGGNHPDMLVIDPEDASELKLEDAVAARDFLKVKPFMGSGRFLMIPDAERLNTSAQNALLKTLEEPPEGTVLLFTSSRPEMFLETVRSRARLVRTGALSIEDCGKVLKDLGVDKGEAEFLSSLGAGSPGKALSYRQVSGSVRQSADDLVKALDAGADPMKVSRPVLDRLDGMDAPAERRLFLSAFFTVLSGIYRRRLASQGSEPLGSVVSCLTEAYRATMQNVRPELVVLVAARRLAAALRGEVSSRSGVTI